MPCPTTVSVIIPNFNYEKTLNECLSAVYSQTFPPLEVIVVDDGSTDSSVDIVQRFPCTIIRTEGNRGPAAARNIGVRSSRGEVLFFVDSDVKLAPDAIEQAVRSLCADPEVGYVYGVYAKKALYDDGMVESYRLLHNHYWQSQIVGRVDVAIFALGALRRESFDAAGPFDESLRQAEDMEYSSRLSRVAGIEVNDSIIGYHDDDDQIKMVLSKVYRRGAAVSSLKARGVSFGRLGACSTSAMLIAACLPFSIFLALMYARISIWVIALPLLLVGAFVGSQFGLARFIRAERGFAFLGFFFVIHFAMYWALAAGMAVGMARGSLNAVAARPNGRRTAGISNQRP